MPHLVLDAGVVNRQVMFVQNRLEAMSAERSHGNAQESGNGAKNEK